ncbi:MAG: MATE family efflux transporter [Alphaproteobacteria bacterium]|nr:MATE family efflux transporter [Alphaproteobacteria bacterium]
MTEPELTEATDPGPVIAGSRHGAWRAELCELLRLAVPLAATQLAQMAILATDTLMLGHLSKEALAAAALGNTVYFFAWLLGCGPANAVSPVIAHVLGEARPEDVRPTVRMGLWAALMVTPPLLVVLLLTHPIMLLLGQAPPLAEGAGRFMSTLCWGLPFAIGFQVLRNYATALSRPVAPMIVVLLAIIFNALGDWCLIFGHLGLPALGLAGSGLASALSNFFSFSVMLAIIHLTPALRAHRILRDFRVPHWGHLRETFILGIPIGLTTIFEAMLFNAATILMGLFGTTALAAHQIAITIPSLTFMVPLGVGLAATVRVGLAAGAGDMVAARRAGFIAMGVAMTFMTVSSAILLIFPKQIAGAWFSSDPANADAIALTVVFLHVAAAFQVVDGLQVSAAMALRGLKDARAPMWIAGASYWLAGFPMCVALGFGLNMRGLGVWIGLAFGLAVAAVLLVWRFAWRSGKMSPIRKDA